MVGGLGVFFFVNLGHILPFSRISIGVRLLLLLIWEVNSFPQLLLLAFVIVLENWPRNVSKFCSTILTSRLHSSKLKFCFLFFSSLGWALYGQTSFEFVYM